MRRRGNKTIRRKTAKLIKYLKQTEPYGDVLSSKELSSINRKVARRLAKKRSGRRGRR